MVKEFTVVRENWLRGENCFVSELLRAKDAKRCCLGFFASECGISDPDIVGVKSLPGISSRVIKNNFESLSALITTRKSPLDGSTEYVENKTHTRLIMRLNDAPIGSIDDDVVIASDAIRESLIKESFAKLGIKINFID